MDASSRNTPNAVPHLVRALDDIIGSLCATGFKETAELLRIARLDLLMRLHGITAEEIELLAATLAGKKQKPRPALRRPVRRGAKVSQIRR